MQKRFEEIEKNEADRKKEEEERIKEAQKHNPRFANMPPEGNNPSQRGSFNPSGPRGGGMGGMEG